MIKVNALCSALVVCLSSLPSADSRLGEGQGQMGSQGHSQRQGQMGSQGHSQRQGQRQRQGRLLLIMFDGFRHDYLDQVRRNHIFLKNVLLCMLKKHLSYFL